MRQDQSFYELLDRYHKGLLSAEEAASLQRRIDSDPEIHQEAKSYLEMLSAISDFGRRTHLKNTLESIHQDITSAAIPVTSDSKSSPRRYWQLAAAAATVVFVSVAGTLFVTDSFKTKEEAYRELRKDVQQIRKSQNQIMKDLAETRENAPGPGKYSGTGFLISNDGYLATSYHVVRELDSVFIENETYGRLKASVVLSDPRSDISILKVVTPGFKIKRPLPYVISPDEANLGEYVYTLGFPREDVVFGEGSVSASTGYRRNPDAYQISVPVNPGNSGGPLLNSSGNLVGVVSGVQTESAGTAFAIKSTRLLDVARNEAIDSVSGPIRLSQRNSLRNLDRVQQVKRWSELVFLVSVYKGK